MNVASKSFLFCVCVKKRSFTANKKGKGLQTGVREVEPHTHAYTYKCACTHTYTYKDTHTDTYMNIYAHEAIAGHICICIYIYIQTTMYRCVNIKKFMGDMCTCQHHFNRNAHGRLHVACPAPSLLRWSSSSKELAAGSLHLLLL